MFIWICVCICMFICICICICASLYTLPLRLRRVRLHCGFFCLVSSSSTSSLFIFSAEFWLQTIFNFIAFPSTHPPSLSLSVVLACLLCLAETVALDSVSDSDADVAVAATERQQQRRRLLWGNLLPYVGETLRNCGEKFNCVWWGELRNCGENLHLHLPGFPFSLFIVYVFVSLFNRCHSCSLLPFTSVRSKLL